MSSYMTHAKVRGRYSRNLVFPVGCFVLFAVVFGRYAAACCVTDAELWVSKNAAGPWGTSVTVCTGSTVYFKAECQVNKDEDKHTIKWEFDYEGGGTDETKCTNTGCADGPMGPGTYNKTASHTYNNPGTKTATVKVYRDGVSCSPSYRSDAVTVHVLGGPIRILGIEGYPQCLDNIEKYLLLANPASTSPLETYGAATPQPTGTTYKWSIISGSSKAHIDGSDTSSTVKLRADAEGNLTLQLKYTKGSGSCTVSLNTAVQKPNKSASTALCMGGRGVCCPGFREAYRDVLYFIRDGTGKVVPHAFWDETLHQEDGWPCDNLIPGDVYTDCFGGVWDQFYIFEYADCSPWLGGSICWEWQSIKISGWPTSGAFWDNFMEWWDAEIGVSDCCYIMVPPLSCDDAECDSCE